MVHFNCRPNPPTSPLPGQTPCRAIITESGKGFTSGIIWCPNLLILSVAKNISPGILSMTTESKVEQTIEICGLQWCFFQPPEPSSPAPLATKTGGSKGPEQINYITIELREKVTDFQLCITHLDINAYKWSHHQLQSKHFPPAPLTKYITLGLKINLPPS